ncbi:MFS transporter [Mesorhizobium sp. M1A.F.Ca.IN.022.07.1.1]|uniref:MFS transporter n=1 Tax=unclassified Mesorhizobium TaxID=325217 RepID=UPI0007FE210A|nr:MULTISPECIES: MFS transporter [unclassified Mesorhizobium]TGV92992.1 MFS transporter [Mesorhizobium sp. M00.F.Ca.ET.158.01.1.1]WIE93921.1 MFS transporter [Mesorhizobium sp. WSM4875]AZO62040.1 MFS transporter [Mesorhizobium sp. M1A.F.Ca.IN.022.06.1.1]MCT2579707.1 MFS transporter [Mesorhizobium sp. P13.3]MDF3168936.1 MFS transporter [Mesorhizobium sp. P16.1]
MTVLTPALPAQAVAEIETRRTAYSKVFWRIVPFLMLCYVVAYLDRVNIGFAKLQMSADLGFSETVYGLGAGIFFIGYFLFEVPSNVILHKVGARMWIARIMITWGLISAGFMFVTSAPTFYLLRFLLGVAEAGFYPGIILFLTYWYPSHRRAKIIAVFMSAIPVSGILGNPLSGWIMDSFDGAHGLAGWQWMFLIEAVPAVLLGIAVLFFLDNGIRQAKWLSETEKQALEEEIAREERHKESGHSVAGIFRDRRVWLMCLIYFTFVMGQYGLTFWMPTLVKATGITGNFNIGLISAIPFICAVVVMNLFGRSADRHRERRWHLVVPALLGAVGFVVAAASSNLTIAIAFLSVAAAGAITCAPLFWSLPTSFLAGTGAAAGIALINSVGNLAGFVSPYLVGYLKDLTGATQVGMYALAAILVLGAVLVLTTPPKLVNR